MECAEERTNDLMQLYDDYISSCTYIRMPEVYAFIAQSPAPRFYVSETRASVVVSDMLAKRAQHYSRMRPLKREMFQEICRRVMKMQRLHPNMPILDCCREIITQPAPKFYITPNTVKVIVSKNRKKWRHKKLHHITSRIHTSYQSNQLDKSDRLDRLDRLD